MKFKKKQSNQKRNISKMAITFYIIAIIVLIFFLISTYNVTTYLMTLMSEGSITITENLMDIVLYYIDNSLMLLVYSLLIFGTGYMIQLFKNISIQEVIEELSEETPEIVEELVEV